MALNRFSRPKIDGQSRRTLVGVTVLVITIFFLDVSSRGMIRTEVRAVIAHVYSLTSSATNFVIHNGFFSRQYTLATENAHLSQLLSQYVGRDAELTALQDENNRLRSLVHLHTQATGTAAAVMSSFTATPNGTFVIGAGSAEGVSVGDAVFSPSNFVLGTVAEVSRHTSLVQLLFAPGESVEVRVHDTALTLDGRGGGNARGRAPHDVHIQVGDIVTAASVAGQSVGVVGSVDEKQSNAYTDVYVRVPENLDVMQFVYLFPLP